MRIAESQVQWERFNAMLVVNTILIGLIGFASRQDSNIPTIIQILFLPMSIFICILWMKMTSRGFMWTKYWTDKARKIEEEYGDKMLVKPFIEGRKHKCDNEVVFNTQRSSELIIKIFIVLYASILIYRIVPYMSVLFRR